MNFSSVSKALEPKSSNRTHLLILAAIALLGTSLVFICTHKFGIGLTPDSTSYIGVARNVAAGKGFTKPTGEVLRVWPPLYPALIALPKLCRFDDLVALRYINMLLLGLTIFLSGFLMLKTSRSLFLAILCSLGVLFSKPLFETFCWVWSETLFVTLIVLFFVAAYSAQKNLTKGVIVALTLITIATNMTRYTGIALIPAGAAVLFFAKAGEKIYKRIGRVILFGAVSSAPLVLWLLRNWLITGTLAGTHISSDKTFSENINLTGEVIAGWFLPPLFFKNIPGVIFFFLFCALITMKFVSVVRQSRRHNQYWLNSPSIPLILFLIVYTAQMVSAVTRVKVDPLGDRLLCPIYVPILLLFFGSVKSIFSLNVGSAEVKRKFYGKIKASLCIGIAIGIWFAVASCYVIGRTQRAYSYGVGGFSNSHWQNSEIITWLRVNRLQGHIFTNDHYALYILTNHVARSSPQLPERSYASDDILRRESQRNVSIFKSAVESGTGAYIVWFLPHHRKYLYDLNQLSDFCQMKVVKRFRDGIILALYPK